MKKITLVLCFSIVGLIGFAQQKQISQKLNESDRVESITIKLGDHVEVVKIEQSLLNVTDFKKSLKFNSDSHELVHNKTTTKNFEYRIVQDAFTYNNYAINYIVKPILNNTMNLSV